MINIHAYLLPIIILIVLYLNAALWNWNLNIFKITGSMSGENSFSTMIFSIFLFFILVGYAFYGIIDLGQFIVNHINIIK